MHRQQRFFCCFVSALVCLACPAIGSAVLFEPSIGGGVEYTDNAKLEPVGVTDVIAVGYLGARLQDDEGRLLYDLDANLNEQNFTKDSYEDRRYYNLFGNANWAMVRDRVNWFVSNRFQQLPVRAIDASTPDNIQDSNIFNFGVDFLFPMSARQSFSITPVYSQYYYEVLSTDNKQLALNAAWSYQLYRRAGIGLNLSARKIDYTETDFLGRKPAGTTFTGVSMLINGVQRRSTYTLNLGYTNVKREGDIEGGGFSGSLNWLADLSSRSQFNLLLSTEITDTSTVSRIAVDNPITGDPNDVQIAADVIRNSVFNAAYLRDDASLQSRLWWEYREMNYSDSPLDRNIRTFGLQMNYPLTQLLNSGLDAYYSRTRQLVTGRVDDRYFLNANVRYRLARKLYTAMDISYRKKESNDLPGLESFDETAVFVRLVYGPGDIPRPTLIGGF